MINSALLKNGRRKTGRKRDQQYADATLPNSESSEMRVSRIESRPQYRDPWQRTGDAGCGMALGVSSRSPLPLCLQGCPCESGYGFGELFIYLFSNVIEGRIV